jgi:hypothetical protein
MTAVPPRRRRKRRSFSGARRAFLEMLEPRLVLNGGPPQVLAHDFPDQTDSPIDSVTLTLSEPLVGHEVRDVANYELVRLGADQTLGGPDDVVQQVVPSYSDGTTQIDLDVATGLSPLTLGDWEKAIPSHGWGGNWRLDTHGLLVETAGSLVGDPAFFISPDDLIDDTFRTRIKVDASEQDDFVGVVFGMQRYIPDTTTFRPTSYYCLSWKRSTETTSFTYYDDLTAEEGLKLIRAENVSGWPDYMIGPFLWDGVHPQTGDRLSVLDSSLGDDQGWEYDTEYDIAIDYASDGTIGIDVRRVADDAVIWQTSLSDPDLLGAGRVGFFNMGQAGVTYQRLGTTESLGEGLYQLTVRGDDPGLHDLDGMALDGDADGEAGGDFQAVALVDFAAPVIESTSLDASGLVVTYADLGGMDHDRLTDVANYQLVASGGDSQFGDEQDVAVTIGNITWRAAGYGYEQAVMSFGEPLESERYQLTVDGTDGVRDRYGRDLQDGDYTQVLSYSAGPTFFSLDLPAEYDTGVSQDDNLTNLSTLEIHAVIDRPGRLRLDLDNEDGYETDIYVPHAGTYVYPAPYSSDGEHRSRGYFTPAYGSSSSQNLYVTIDTEAPAIGQYDPFNAGLTSVDHVTFELSEEIVPATLTMDAVSLSGPEGMIPLTALTHVGGNTYQVDFATQSAWGWYQLALHPEISDAAGNHLDTDGDRLGGEYPEDAASLDFLIGYGGVNLVVDGSFESAGADSGLPNAAGIWSGDRSYWTDTYGGIVPVDGAKMLQFRNTGSSAAAGVTWGDVWQLIDLSAFAEDVASGQAVVWASSQFNRGEGTQYWDTQFAITLSAYSGDPSNFPTQWGSDELASAVDYLFADNDRDSWQGLSDGLVLPPATDFVAVQISAIENVYDNDSSSEFYAHFADDVSVALAVPLDKPYVVSSTPQGSVAESPDFIDVTFSEPIDATTFTAGDISLQGPAGAIAVDSPEHLGGDVWRIHFDPVTNEGDYTYSVGPDIQDLDGRAMDQNRDGGAGDPVLDVYTATFRVDFTPLVVESHSPVGEQNSFIDFVDVVFSEEIVGDTFSAQDVVFTTPGGTVAVSDPIQQDAVTWRIPFEAQHDDGSYSIVVGPDIDDLAGQAMLEAYTGTFEIRLPNLSGSNLQVPAVGGSGTDVEISWDVNNSGSAAVHIDWTDDVYLSTDAVFGDDTWVAAFDRPNGLDSGESYHQSVTATLPQVAEGDYWILVVVDGAATVDESLESDNVIVAGPMIVRRPNLTVGNLQFPAYGSPGERLEFSGRITNTGAVPTSGSWHVRAFLSEDEALGDDTPIGYFAAPPNVLDTGEHYDRTSNWDMPELPPGDYFLIVQADSADALAEADESDNIAIAGPINVRSLDLVVTDLTLPTNSRSGDEVTIRWQLHNNGTGTVTDSFSDMVYVQNQTTHEFWYQYVGFNPHTDGPIGPGASLAREAVFQIPEGEDGVGEFWVEITTDVLDAWGDDDIYEWNDAGDAEDNNSLTGVFESTLAIYPDLVIRPLQITPDNPQTGEQILVEWRLENQGEAPVETAFVDRVEVVNTATGTTLVTEYLPYDPTVSGVLAVGSGIDRQLTVGLPEGSISAGELQVIVFADGDEEIFEYNEDDGGEGNNEASALITASLAAYPDLAVTEIEFPSLIIGDPAQVTIQWTVENQGDGLANGPWTDRVIVSENDVLGDWDDAELIRLEHTPSLDPSAHYDQSYSLILPARFEGRYHLYVMTDIDGLVFRR